jgi:hypothetical protein
VARQAAEAPAGRTDRSPSEEDNLSFTFGEDEDEWDAELLHPEAPGEQFPLDVEPKEMRAGTPPHADPTKPQADFFGDELDEEEGEGEPEEDEESKPRDGISLRPVFFFLFLVVTAYAVLAATLYANQEWAEEIAREVPIVGSGSRDRFLARKVTLMAFEGRYERTKNGTNIFVITGNVTNHAAVALSGVRVRTQLLDNNGAVLDERVTFCGSAVPLKILRDLSVAEVSIIGRLKPPRVLLLQPGEQFPCMAVFTDPSPQIAEFTTQVVAAQRQA